MAQAGDCSSAVGQWLGRWKRALDDARWDECLFRSSWLDGVDGTTIKLSHRRRAKAKGLP